VGASHSSSLTFAAVDSDGGGLPGFFALGLGVAFLQKNKQHPGRRDLCLAAPQRLAKVPTTVEEAAAGKGGAGSPSVMQGAGQGEQEGIGAGRSSGFSDIPYA